MAEVSSAPRAEEVRLNAGHVLFVEGSLTKARDLHVLDELVGDLPVQVWPLGRSLNVRSAAEALRPTHPHYYFLVDRDHNFDVGAESVCENLVEGTWRNFPDKKHSNLLIWRRRELENYFLIPDYLARSQFLEFPQRLSECIRGACTKRLYLDAANLVISILREKLRRTWIKCFEPTKGFESADKALGKLLGMQELRSKPRSDSQVLRAGQVEKAFRGFVEMMLGGASSPVFGQGRWLEMVRGSAVLPQVIDSCFRVRDAQGRPVDGEDRIRAVLKDLLSLDLPEQPTDFQELHRLIRDQIRA